MSSPNEYLCPICKKPIENSAWSICYDDLYEVNCWGGYTHAIQAYLHVDCVLTLLDIKEVNIYGIS